MSDGSPITTHVLDLASGTPAVGVEVGLERLDEVGAWIRLASGRTDDDGRVGNLLVKAEFKPGTYRVAFETAAYLRSQDRAAFFPRVVVEFTVDATDRHYHVPLLLSPYGYSTYRGS